MNTSERFLQPQSEFSDTSQERVELWKQKLLEVKQIADATGRGIDEGVQETVAAFNINGIPTSQSCEGHFEVEGGHRPWPWIEVGAPDQPMERFVGESEAYVEIARNNNVSVEDLKIGEPEELYWEVQRSISHNLETDEYKRWEEENKKLWEKMSLLLDEFYNNRESEEQVKLKLGGNNGSSFEVSSEQGLFLRFISNELTDEEKEVLLTMLPLRQAEMKAFTEFLKSKFLDN